MSDVYAFPPHHLGQTWETFDPEEWNSETELDYTYQDEFHSVYTISIIELMQSGVFDWARDELNWRDAALDAEQYTRFCAYFEQRFMFREISIVPPLKWMIALKRKLVYELMPKYKPLYEQIAAGISPLGENEYYKERHIGSDYPETLLSGNASYISTGDDKEFERIKIDNVGQALVDYQTLYKGVDEAMADELEVLFINIYTSYANGF